MGEVDGGYVENFPEVVGPWSFDPLPEEGIRLHSSVRTRSLFPPPPPWRFFVAVACPQAPTRVLVAEGAFPDLARAQIPYGPLTAGLRLRARPVREPLPAAGPQSFAFEVVNEGRTPVVLLRPATWPAQITLEIDGEVRRTAASQPGVLGWAARHTVDEPQEGFVGFREGPPPLPGGHVLRLRLHGSGGTYLNVSNEKIPLLDAEVWSAPLGFTVE